MIKFRTLDTDEIVELYEDVKLMGIKEEVPEEPYELCDVDDPDSFQSVYVCHQDGKYYVDYDIPSNWYDINNCPIVLGTLEDLDYAY